MEIKGSNPCRMYLYISVSGSHGEYGTIDVLVLRQYGQVRFSLELWQSVVPIDFDENSCVGFTFRLSIVSDSHQELKIFATTK